MGRCGQYVLLGLGLEGSLVLERLELLRVGDAARRCQRFFCRQFPRFLYLSNCCVSLPSPNLNKVYQCTVKRELGLLLNYKVGYIVE